MPNAVVVALCGRAGSGKTTVAEQLLNVLFPQVRKLKVSFAAPLKLIARDLWEFSDEQLYGDAKIKETTDPRWGITPRLAMQRLGGSARDHLGKNVWVQGALNQIEKLGQSGMELVVIDDLRHVNEADALRGLPQGLRFLVKLVCPDSISDQGASQHPSEREVDEIPEGWFDHILKVDRSPGAQLLINETVQTIVPAVLSRLSFRTT